MIPCTAKDLNDTPHTSVARNVVSRLAIISPGVRAPWHAGMEHPHGSGAATVTRSEFEFKTAASELSSVLVRERASEGWPGGSETNTNSSSAGAGHPGRCGKFTRSESHSARACGNHRPASLPCLEGASQLLRCWIRTSGMSVALSPCLQPTSVLG
eukprot:516798-Rhodomonas_salina.5